MLNFDVFEAVVDAMMESCSSGNGKVTILKVNFHYRSAKKDCTRIKLFYRNIPCKLTDIYPSLSPVWYKLEDCLVFTLLIYKSSKISTAKTERLNFVSQSRFSRDCDMVLNYWDDDEIKTLHNTFVNTSESIMDR